MSGVVGEDLLGVFAVSVVANADGLWMVVLLRDCQATNRETARAVEA
jgi:hypothetical protein